MGSWETSQRASFSGQITGTLWVAGIPGNARQCQAGWWLGSGKGQGCEDPEQLGLKDVTALKLLRGCRESRLVQGDRRLQKLKREAGVA